MYKYYDGTWKLQNFAEYAEFLSTTLFFLFLIEMIDAGCVLLSDIFMILLKMYLKRRARKAEERRKMLKISSDEFLKYDNDFEKEDTGAKLVMVTGGFAKWVDKDGIEIKSGDTEEENKKKEELEKLKQPVGIGKIFQSRLSTYHKRVGMMTGKDEGKEKTYGTNEEGEKLEIDDKQFADTNFKIGTILLEKNDNYDPHDPEQMRQFKRKKKMTNVINTPDNMIAAFLKNKASEEITTKQAKKKAEEVADQTNKLASFLISKGQVVAKKDVEQVENKRKTTIFTQMDDDEDLDVDNYDDGEKFMITTSSPNKNSRQTIES